MRDIDTLELACFVENRLCPRGEQAIVGHSQGRNLLRRRVERPLGESISPIAFLSLVLAFEVEPLKLGEIAYLYDAARPSAEFVCDIYLRLIESDLRCHNFPFVVGF